MKTVAVFNERDTLRIENGKLIVGGCDALALGKEYGTPCYILDQAYVETMAKVFRDAIQNNYGGNGLVKYASKAFCCKEIYRIMDTLGLGLDVVSGGELYTARSVNFPADRIYFHGNNKSDREIAEAMDYGVEKLVVDNIDEISHIAEIAAKRGIKQKVLLRVNPGVEAHTHHYIQTARLDSKFGLAIEKGYAERGVCEILKKSSLILSGLHCHIGSQIFEKQAFSAAACKMMLFIKQIKTQYKYETPELNLGGGYGIWYSAGDKVMRLSDYADFMREITDTIQKKCDEYDLKKPYLTIEPGRSIVGEAGITLYTVGNVKNIEGIRKFVSIDGGMFENPRYALYQAKYTALSASKPNAPHTDRVTLTGKCCESSDMIIDEAYLPVATQRGDIVAVFSTGAYHYSMASNYNRNFVPPVVAVKNGRSRYLVKPQSYEDLVRNDAVYHDEL